MVHQTSVQETLVWPTSVWVWEWVGEKTLLGISLPTVFAPHALGSAWNHQNQAKNQAGKGKHHSTLCLLQIQGMHCSSVPIKSSFHIPLFYRESWEAEPWLETTKHSSLSCLVLLSFSDFSDPKSQQIFIITQTGHRAKFHHSAPFPSKYSTNCKTPPVPFASEIPHREGSPLWATGK